LSACPITIHALLHIADSILAAGPVWAYWAFPMERYCGLLQPAIRSRRHPYPSLNRFVLDDARLKQVTLKYGLSDELQLEKKPALRGVKYPGYDTCTLLPKRRTGIKLNHGQRTGLLGCLSTRFTQLTLTQVKKLCPVTAAVEEFGRVQIFEDADLVRTANFGQRAAEDSRDATFVWYEMYIDRNAAYRRRRSIFDLRTFYGQVEHIYAVQLRPKAIPRNLHDGIPAVVVVAFIRTCRNIVNCPSGLDIHYYDCLGGVDVIDIPSIQCLVGCIKDGNRWAIIDCSGTLSRAICADGDELSEGHLE
ncbi:hypothetical protein K474DRAFT_1604760, partial [Panus rudis PR-1116 ss-1]